MTFTAPDSPKVPGLFFGRSLVEYEEVFHREAHDYQGMSVLDVAAGPASFTAEATALGIKSTACDPRYRFDVNTLVSEGRFGIEQTMRYLEAQAFQVDEKYRNCGPDMRTKAETALERFVTHYREKDINQRYSAGALPNLPFATGEFDIALCANFLFIYSDLSPVGHATFDFDFHVRAVFELLRVAKREVRIRPIEGGRESGLHPYAERLLPLLRDAGVGVELERRDHYRFIPNNSALLVLRPATAS